MLTFRNYYFCQLESGDSLELYDPGVERRFLAFDRLLGHFVDFHVFPGSDINRDDFRQRAQEARELRSAHLGRFVAWGEDDDMSFYITRLADGPNLESYLRWLGEVPRPIFNLLLSHYARLIKDVAPHFHLLPTLALSDFQVVRTSEGQIRLMLTRFGLQKQPAVSSGENKSSEVKAFPVLDEHVYGDADVAVSAEDAIAAFDALTKTDPAACLRPFKNLLRCLTEEALTAKTVDSIHAPPPLLLESVLGGAAALDRRLDDRFEPLDEDGWQPGSYVMRCRDLETKKLVDVGFLPAEKVLPSEGLRTLQEIASRSERPNKDRSPHIVPLAYWMRGDGGKFSCYAEECSNGFTLGSYLAAQGGRLQPAEATRLLHVIELGLQELAGARSLLTRLQPEDVIFQFRGREEISEEELRRLSKRKIDELPDFDLRIRAHASMASLADGWSPVPQLAEAPMAKGSASDVARLAPALSSRLFTDLGFILLGLSPDDREEDVRSRGLPPKLERLLLDERSGKFRAGPPLPPGRFLNRLEEAVTGKASSASGSQFRKVGEGAGAGSHSQATPSQFAPEQSIADPTPFKPAPTRKVESTERDAPSEKGGAATSPSGSTQESPRPDFITLGEDSASLDEDGDSEEGGFAQLLFAGGGNQDNSDRQASAGLPSTDPNPPAPSLDARSILRAQRRRSWLRMTAAAALGLAAAYGGYLYLNRESAPPNENPSTNNGGLVAKDPKAPRELRGPNTNANANANAGATQSPPAAPENQPTPKADGTPRPPAVAGGVPELTAENSTPAQRAPVVVESRPPRALPYVEPVKPEAKQAPPRAVPASASRASGDAGQDSIITLEDISLPDEGLPSRTLRPAKPSAIQLGPAEEASVPSDTDARSIFFESGSPSAGDGPPESATSGDRPPSAPDEN